MRNTWHSPWLFALACLAHPSPRPVAGWERHDARQCLGWVRKPGLAGSPGQSWGIRGRRHGLWYTHSHDIDHGSWSTGPRPAP